MLKNRLEVLWYCGLEQPSACSEKSSRPAKEAELCGEGRGQLR